MAFYGRLSALSGAIRYAIAPYGPGWVEKVIPPSDIYKGRQLSELWAEVI